MPYPLTDAKLDALLHAYVDPVLGRNLAEAGCLRRAEIAEGSAHIEVELGFAAASYAETLRERLERLIADGLGCDAEVSVRWQVEIAPVPAKLSPLPTVRNIIAVASGKGGVGKSTVAANLALALAAEGARVAVLDADIYGPSQPRMLGAPGKPQSPDGKHMLPLQAHGLQLMSIGNLIDEEQPTIWRGPMVTQALMQLLGETRWDDVDYMIVDLPPGTGDVQLTLAQRIPVSGAVIVTTPQDIALLDARKGLRMFQRVSVPVLGVVENMAVFCCPNCGHESHIFGSGGGESLSAQYGTTLLGSLPLSAAIRAQADGGAPTVVSEPDSGAARSYRDIALRAAAALAHGGLHDDAPVIGDSDD